MKCLTSAVFLALAAEVALAAPVFAMVGAGGRTGSAQTFAPVAAPAGQFATKQVAVTHFAKNTRPKRRARAVQPATGQAVTAAGNDGAQTATQVDCTIQSHPDCPHRPAAPKSLDHMGAYNFTVEIGGN